MRRLNYSVFSSSVVCDVCGRGEDFELLTDDSKNLDNKIEEHVQLIRDGYSKCEHITNTSQTKVQTFNNTTQDKKCYYSSRW